MAQRRRGDRLERRLPEDWVDDGIWRVMVCGPARAGASWICEALRGLAREAGKWPEPPDGRVEDATLRPLIGEAWLELDADHAWILRAHLDATDLLFGWRLVVVHRDPREVLAELRRVSGAPLPFLMDHLQLAAELVDKAARLPGCPVLIVPWARLVAEPRAVVEALARHLDLAPEPAMIDRVLQTVGPPDRRPAGDDEAPHAAAFEDAGGAEEATAAVTTALAPWMRRWGYPVPAGPAAGRRGRARGAPQRDALAVEPA